MVLQAHGFRSPQLTVPCCSLISSVSLCRSPHFISLLPCFFASPSSSSPLPHTCSPYLSFSICLLPTPLCPSPLHTSPAWCLCSPPNIVLPLQICSACVRCKSCGATPGKNWDVEWSGDYSLCPRCTQLFEKGGDLAGDRGPGGHRGVGQVPRQAAGRDFSLLVFLHSLLWSLSFHSKYSFVGAHLVLKRGTRPL